MNDFFACERNWANVVYRSQIRYESEKTNQSCEFPIESNVDSTIGLIDFIFFLCNCQSYFKNKCDKRDFTPIPVHFYVHRSKLDEVGAKLGGFRLTFGLWLHRGVYPSKVTLICMVYVNDGTASILLHCSILRILYIHFYILTKTLYKKFMENIHK